MFALAVAATSRDRRDGNSIVVTDVTQVDNAFIVFAPRAPCALCAFVATALAKGSETYGKAYPGCA